jgi:hypothetical protein
VAGAGWQASLSAHPVDVIEACQRLHNRFAPGYLQIDALELAQLQIAGFGGCNLPPHAPGNLMRRPPRSVLRRTFEKIAAQ